MGSRQKKQSKEETTRRLVVASLAEMPAMGTEWLWQDRIALESVTLVMGNPGAGKSQVAMDLAARVSRGVEWPDGAPSRGAGDVMMLCAEDHLLRRVRPTLAAAGADLGRFRFPFQSIDDCTDETARREIHLKRDLDLVEDYLGQAPGTKLLIIDSFQQFMGSGSRGLDTVCLDTVSVLRRLDRWATKYQLAVLVVTHLRPGSGEAVHRAVGGAALTTLARGIWLVVRPEVRSQGSGIRSQGTGVRGQESGVRGERRLFLPVKNNLAEEGLGLAFQVRKRAENLVSTVEWLEGEVDTTADEALGALRRKAIADSQAVGEATEFLEGALAGGPRLAKEVMWEGKEVHGLSVGSLKRGRKELEVKAFRPKTPGAWWICLKDDESGKEDPKAVESVEGLEGLEDDDVVANGAGERNAESAEAAETRGRRDAESAVREQRAPLAPLAKNTGNNGVFEEAQAAPLAPLAKCAGNCDEIRGEKLELAAPLAGMEASLNVAEGRGAAGCFAGVIGGDVK